MSTLEREIESTLRNQIESRGGFCLKWVCPGWAGVPDRIVLLPGAKVIFVETKRPKGGVVSARQKWWAAKLRQLGFTYYLIWTKEEVTNFVQCEFGE